jgi:streptogramin lyase
VALRAPNLIKALSSVSFGVFFLGISVFCQRSQSDITVYIFPLTNIYIVNIVLPDRQISSLSRSAINMFRLIRHRISIKVNSLAFVAFLSILLLFNGYVAALSTDPCVITSGAPGSNPNCQAVTEYPVNQVYKYGINNITEGVQDKSYWFTDPNNSAVGQIMSNGAITEYTTPVSKSCPSGITRGSDGNEWFTDTCASSIASITPSGAITEYPLPTPYLATRYITKGSHGSIWTVGDIRTGQPPFYQYSEHLIERTSNGAMKVFTLPASSCVNSIIEGTDKNIWFTDGCNSSVDRLTVATGSVSEYATPSTNSDPDYMTLAPDGTIWFGEQGNSPKLASITPSGVTTEYTIPQVTQDNELMFPAGLTTTSDGNVWFVDSNTGLIGKLTPSTSSFVIYDPSQILGTHPSEIVRGTNGELWFTQNSYIGELNTKKL